MYASDPQFLRANDPDIVALMDYDLPTVEDALRIFLDMHRGDCDVSGPALGSAMAPPNQVVLHAESHGPGVGHGSTSARRLKAYRLRLYCGYRKE